MAKLPSDVLEKASYVSHKLATLAEEGRRQSKGSKVAVRRKVLLRVSPFSLPFDSCDVG